MSFALLTRLGLVCGTLKLFYASFPREDRCLSPESAKVAEEWLGDASVSPRGMGGNGFSRSNTHKHPNTGQNANKPSVPSYRT